MPRKAKRKKKPAARPRAKRQYAGYLLLVLLAAGAVYLGYLNHLINARFEGDTWALPSRVYARALELFPGLALTSGQLEYELGLSSYLRVDAEPLPGQYRRLGESIELHARAFEFSSGLQPARLLQVFFDEQRVAALTDSTSGVDLSLFRLPPVIIGSYYPGNDEDRLLLAENEVPAENVCGFSAAR